MIWTARVVLGLPFSSSPFVFPAKCFETLWVTKIKKANPVLALASISLALTPSQFLDNAWYVHNVIESFK